MDYSQRENQSSAQGIYTPYSQDNNRYNDSDNDSSTTPEGSEDSFTEESSSYTDSDDNYNESASTRKQPRKQKAANQAKTGTVPRSGTRKNYDKQFSSETYDNTPRKIRKRKLDEDSTSDYSSDNYSSQEEERVKGNVTSEKWNSDNNGDDDDEDDEDESSSNDENDYDVGRFEKKEEFQGRQIERVIGTEIRKRSEDEKRKYYVKYKNESYVHCEWLTREQVEAVHNGDYAMKKWKREKKKNGNQMETAEESQNNLQIIISQKDIINPDYFEVDRVIAFDREIGKYLVLWSAANQNDEEHTWEEESLIDNEAALNAFKERESHYRDVVLMKKKSTDYIQRPSNYVKYTQENKPLFKDGLELRDYQLDGLNWLRKCWYEGKSSILADEMGLGKTVQGVCIVNDIYKLGFRGPFLAIAPKSTLMQWEREFHSWTDLNVVRYSDGKKAREIIRKHELYWTDENGVNDERYEKFEVMLMNYEKLLTEDVEEIVNKFTWEYVLVDEAHRLKNSTNKTYQIFENLLKEKKIKHLLLMTGTPMQNVNSDIWGLLHLVDPGQFNDLEEFKRFDNGENGEELQSLIGPYMLRRVKNQVEKTIGSKEENIVEIEISKSQSKLYVEIPKSANQQSSDQTLSSNSNVKMQLRKVCNHPYLLEDPKHQIDTLLDPSEKFDNPIDQLICSCGKMMFVDKLLQYLRAKDSKVLIFSQMTLILDIFEEYCRGRNFKFERIDGQIKGSKRQQAMDRFNDLKTDTFIFLLCTKAGGQGLNLTAANYVIIYDSDWNPQNDIQAQARCHRIGQKNKVEVYRLVSRGTYETKMLKESLGKMKLDSAIQKKKDEKSEVQAPIEETRYVIKVDLSRLNDADIPQLLDDKITVHSVEELNSVLESENKEGDLDSKEFWENISLENQLDNPRSRRHNHHMNYDDDDDDIYGRSRDEDEFPFKQFDRMRKTLLRFGWGKWDRIRDEGKLLTMDNGRMQEVFSVIVYAILNPSGTPAENGYGEFSRITGFDVLSSTQQRNLKKLFRKNYAQKSLLDRRARDRLRLFKLKLFNDHFDPTDSTLPGANAQQDGPHSEKIDWLPTDDWKIVKGVQNCGWDNWKSISASIEHEGAPEDEFKKFLKKRFEWIFTHLDSYPSFANEFHQKLHKHHRGGSSGGGSGGGGSSERRLREQKRKEKRERKEMQRRKEMTDPHILKLKLLSKALCLLGEPMTDENWRVFDGFCGATNNSDHETIGRIIRAVHRLLGSKNRDPEFVFEEEKDFRFITEKVADQIATSCRWFKKFRTFYSNEFNESKLSSLERVPDWWDHISYDPVLFKHVDTYGFSRPYGLIALPPFNTTISPLSAKRVDELARLEASSEGHNSLDGDDHIYAIHNINSTSNENNGNNSMNDNNNHSKHNHNNGDTRTHRVENALREHQVDIAPFDMFVHQGKLMDHIDLIINDIQTEKLPQTVIIVNPKELAFELPKNLGTSYIESLGEGEFRAIDGYLYRAGFSVKVKYNNLTYQCKISDSGYTPFQVTPPNGRECIGKTPLDAWTHALNGDHPDSDPFELFGIGHPTVRYWMQKELGGKRVSDYRAIKFENFQQQKQKKPKTDKAEKPPLLPRFGGMRKKSFFPLPP